MKYRVYRLYIVLIFLVVFLAWCSNTTTVTPAPTTSPTEAVKAETTAAPKYFILGILETVHISLAFL